MEVQSILIAVVSLVVGLGLGALGLHIKALMAGEAKKNEAEKEAERIISRAKSKSQKIERESKTKAKDFETRARKNAENEVRKMKQKLSDQENDLKQKEIEQQKELKRKLQEHELKMNELSERNDRLQIAEERTRKLETEVNEQTKKLEQKLEKVSGYTPDQAKTEMKIALEEEARNLAASEIQKIEEQAQEEAKRRSYQILCSAISRFASEVSTERTTSIIGLTSDEMKGKIIGREGRNIRALEAACGVDLIVDETPESVVISSFDPLRREIARQTLEHLMEDGRVHPARIEEVVTKVKSDIAVTINEDGEKACIDLGLSGVHLNIQKLIGQLKYRHSGMQNLYNQSIEMAYVAGLLAGEFGANVQAARRAGLLSFIGRCIDHNVEGSYSSVGADFARRHGEKDHICQAIRCHTGNLEATSVLDHLVQAAFNLTESRPGAKRTMMENYIRRLEDLESIGNSFDGVSRTFALQAGKEIRVLVDSGKITDGQSKMLVRDIARKIERELNYPGQIKVSVVRETRIVEHAR